MDTGRHSRGTEFGEFLRDARERRGLTLLQISNETKIPWRHLDAFERGDLTVVPNGMYRRAEVRAYARAVGLDPNVALARLDHALIATGLTPAPPEPHARAPRPAVLATLGVVGVAGVLVTVWALWTRDSGEQSPAQPASARPAQAQDASPAATVAPAAPHVRSATGDAVPSVAGTTFNPPSPEHASIATPVNASPPDAADTAVSHTGTTVPFADAGLVVTTDPPGARVTVDGIGWGTTPVTIRFLSSGDKTLRVIKNGYVSEERRIHVVTDRQTTINLTLQSAP